MLSLLRSPKPIFRHLLIGDWLTIIFSTIITVYLFQVLWSHEHASKVQIRIGDKVHAVYDINQQRYIKVQGAMGDAFIHISQGKVRFSKSPCHNQYCVHQGWLTRSGQAAICLPNQISLELIGEQKPYDSLNY
ncbi:MAG TPA: NusG domain II-containing protein [Methylotenera sp.]